MTEEDVVLRHYSHAHRRNRTWTAIPSPAMGKGFLHSDRAETPVVSGISRSGIAPMTPRIAEARSLGDLFKTNCRYYSDKAAYLRPTKSGHVPVPYSEALETAFAYAKGLDSFGLQKGDCVALVAETSVDWALTDWAAQTLGIVLVPIYPTLPADQAQYIASDCGAKLVVAQDATQAAKFPEFNVVLIGAGLSERTSALTREEWDRRTQEVSRTDLATIIYTSGTTGQPKGAMLTHAGFLDLSQSIHDTYAIGENDTFLSFLPLSHVFERYAGHVLAFAVGATVAYVSSLAALFNDLPKIRPTIMTGVPRFFESLRLRILEGVEKQPRWRQILFHLALSQGLLKARGQFAPLFPVTDALVGKKIRDRTGSNIRFFVSGGAALAPQVSEFYIAFGLTVLQGYGLTETTAATCLNLPEDNRPHTVGPPIPCVEIRIASDGEILVRGSAVMTGYHRLPDASAEAIDAQGWFHTGDIGEFDRGNLKITDRKKDILVLANGKNIAPQRIEAKLKESEYIGEAVLFGDGLEYCIAVIVPEFERVKIWLAKEGVHEKDPSKIVSLDAVRALIKSEVDKANKQLADFEKVKRHTLIGSSFSIETGELTPSLKVRRKFVREKFASEIDTLKK